MVRYFHWMAWWVKYARRCLTTRLEYVLGLCPQARAEIIRRASHPMAWIDKDFLHGHLANGVLLPIVRPHDPDSLPAWTTRIHRHILQLDRGSCFFSKYTIDQLQDLFLALLLRGWISRLSCIWSALFMDDAHQL